MLLTIQSNCAGNELSAMLLDEREAFVKRHLCTNSRDRSKRQGVDTVQYLQYVVREEVE